MDTSQGLLRRLAIRATTLAFAATLVTASACSHNDGSIFIAGILAPPTGSQSGACLYQANPAGPFESSGLLDVALTDHYVASILVANQLVPRGDNANLRVETNRFVIQGAIVRITDSQGAPVRKPYTIQGGGEVDPASGGSPGYSVFSTTIIDADTARQLRKAASPQSVRLVTYFKVFGQTTGGTSIESMEFLFPVDTCIGCLVTVPSGVACASSAVGGSSTVTTPCIAGQDQPVDCRLCQGNPACKL